MQKLTVIGIGRLGLCTALIFEKAGFDVLGVDVDQSYVDRLNNKTFVSHEPYVMEYLMKSQNFKASNSLDEGLAFSDMIFIVVPTPNGGGQNHYDHSILGHLLSQINQKKIENKHLIVCCTVMPHYIDNIGKFLIKDCLNVTLNYNPEFIAQGNIISSFENPDIVLIGQENSEIGSKLELIYNEVCKKSPYPKICRMTPLEAEITKIAINGYITCKISYANLISDVCDRVGINKSTVLSSIGSDSRIGQKYLKPGYSYGGPCFPRDTKALRQYITSLSLEPTLVEATEKYNELHTIYQTQQLLNENKDTYIFENVTYKENCKVPIIEESAKLKIAKQLALKGKIVIIKDEQYILDLVKLEYGNLFVYTSSTNHPNIN